MLKPSTFLKINTTLKQKSREPFFGLPGYQLIILLSYGLGRPPALRPASISNCLLPTATDVYRVFEMLRDSGMVAQCSQLPVMGACGFKAVCAMLIEFSVL